MISVGSCGEAQRVLKRVEREASHRYQTLTLPEDGAANCLHVNGTLIHRSREEAPKSDAVTKQIDLIHVPTCCFLQVCCTSLNDKTYGTKYRLSRYKSLQFKNFALTF